jgi:hypothetical protein
MAVSLLVGTPLVQLAGSLNAPFPLVFQLVTARVSVGQNKIAAIEIRSRDFDAGLFAKLMFMRSCVVLEDA